MASRKMTFTLPEQLADRFVKRVPARERSKYLSQALSEKLAAREKRFVRACEVANQDAEALVIEQEFADMPDQTTESWTDAPTR
jgi:hypothetical protein